jgi:hypothetical protein
LIPQYFIAVRKNVARHFSSPKQLCSATLVHGKKFRTLSVDNFVRKWQGLR